MSDAPAVPVAPRTDVLAPGIRLYTLVCVVSAIAVSIPLLARGMNSGALLPAFAGVALVLVRWRVGPLLFVVSLLWLTWADRVGLGPMQLAIRVLTIFVSLLSSGDLLGLGFFNNPRPRLARPDLMLDVILVSAFVVYLVAYYRLLGVTRSIFPIDYHRRAPPKVTKSSGAAKRGRVLEPKRSAALIDARELGKLAPAGIIATVLAQYVLQWLQRRRSGNDLASHLPLGINVQIRDNIWHVLLLLGFFGVGLMVVASVLNYMGLRRQSPAEAALFLQDQLWRQTRREQARLSRWLAWAEKHEADRRKSRS
jgi:hypothetical protein